MKATSRGAALLAVLAAVVASESGAVERLCGAQYLRTQVEAFPLRSFKTARAWQGDERIQVGSKREFHVRGRFNLLSATCQFVGNDSYVFVEDAQWDANGGPVLQVDADFIGELLESATPADATRGLLQLETETFGPTPDVDNDPRIFVLVLELDDSLLGFFDPGIAIDPNPQLRRDLIFVNSSFVTNRYVTGGTLAHELQHLIHWGLDDDEEVWLDEGLAGYAELISGYPEIDINVVPAFLKVPGIDLTTWHGRAYNYGSAYLYVAFLAERFGIELMADLVSEPRNGIDGMDATLVAYGANFLSTWADWTAANYAGTDPLYGYGAINERRAMSLVTPRLPFERVGGVVENQWGAAYIIFRDQGSAEIDFFGDAAGRYVVQLYEIRQGGGSLQSVQLDADNRGFARVANADSFVVIVGRTSARGSDFEISARRFDPITAVFADGQMEGSALKLNPPFPNPFNSEAVLSFYLPYPGFTGNLRLFGSLGNPVRYFVLEGLPAGSHAIVWDGKDDRGVPVASGRYTAKLQFAHEARFKPLTLLR